MRTALVTGASGLVGAEVSRQLATDGVRVRALVRPSTLADRLPVEALERVRCPDLDVDCLRSAVAGVDVVFHIGARVDQGATFRTDDAIEPFMRDNVTRTEALLEASLEKGVGRFVLMSSSSVYAPGSTSPIPEDGPTAPISAYGRSKLAAESVVWRYRARGQGATVLRGSLIFGPGDRQFRPLVDRIMRIPAVPLPGGGRSLHDLVHVSDVARLAILAARSDVAEGRTYNAASGMPLSLREIVRRLSLELGYGPRIVPVPRVLMGLAFRPVRALLTRAVPELDSILTRSLMDYLGHDLYFATTRASMELGYAPSREFGRS